MNDNDEFSPGLVVGMIIASLFWLFLLLALNASWKKVAVEKGHADYSQATGEWQWKAIPKKDENVSD